MGDKPISFRDKDGNFVSAADVWNAEKLEELFNTLNPNRRLRLEREKLAKEKADEPRIKNHNTRLTYLHKTRFSISKLVKKLSTGLNSLFNF